MIARIYTADEARALREAATPGPWHHQSTAQFRGQILAGDVNITVVGGVFSQDAVLLAAAPDLAASVEHHAARADAAEQRAGEWAHRAGARLALAVVAEAECNALRARIVELTAALRDYAPRCGECAERALWYFADWRVKREYAACDAHRSTLPEGHDDVPHAATLRSLDAPALVVDDAACAAIDGAASIGPQGVDATEREVLP